MATYMDNKHTISEKVLDRIEEAKAMPRARSYFILKNVGMWALAGLSIVIGGLAISSVIFRLVNAGPALRPGAPPPGEVLLVIPFLWLITIAVFGFLAYSEIRSTNRGYRYELSTLMLGTMLASCVLGIAFYTAGAGFVLDRFAARHLPFHADLERIQRDRWLKPEDGFLVGMVREETEESMLLTDPHNITWTITFAHTVPDEEFSRIEEGERVGIRGEIIDSEAHTFRACDIRSLEFEGRGLPPPPPHERKVPPLRTNGCEDVRPLD